jgi:Ca2+-binding EF-hand superfamily protein
MGFVGVDWQLVQGFGSFWPGKRDLEGGPLSALQVKPTCYARPHSFMAARPGSSASAAVFGADDDWSLEPDELARKRQTSAVKQLEGTGGRFVANAVIEGPVRMALAANGEALPLAPTASEILKVSDCLVRSGLSVMRLACLQDPVEVFRRFDVDGNGEINVGEFMQMLPQLGVLVPAARAIKLFRALDEDESGALSLDEFRVAAIALDPTSGSPMVASGSALLGPRESFMLFDRDNSGSIDEDEFVWVLEFMGYEIGLEDERLVETMFRKYDKDRSGAIEYEEFRTLWFDLCDVRGELRARGIDDFPDYAPRVDLVERLKKLIDEEEAREQQAIAFARSWVKWQDVVRTRRRFVRRALRRADRTLEQALDFAGQVYMFGNGGHAEFASPSHCGYLIGGDRVQGLWRRRIGYGRALPKMTRPSFRDSLDTELMQKAPVRLRDLVVDASPEPGPLVSKRRDKGLHLRSGRPGSAALRRMGRAVLRPDGKMKRDDLRAREAFSLLRSSREHHHPPGPIRRESVAGERKTAESGPDGAVAAGAASDDDDIGSEGYQSVYTDSEDGDSGSDDGVQDVRADNVQAFDVNSIRESQLDHRGDSMFVELNVSDSTMLLWGRSVEASRVGGNCAVAVDGVGRLYFWGGVDTHKQWREYSERLTTAMPPAPMVDESTELIRASLGLPNPDSGCGPVQNSLSVGVWSSHALEGLDGGRPRVDTAQSAVCDTPKLVTEAVSQSLALYRTEHFVEDEASIARPGGGGSVASHWDSFVSSQHSPSIEGSVISPSSSMRGSTVRPESRAVSKRVPRQHARISLGSNPTASGSPPSPAEHRLSRAELRQELPWAFEELGPRSRERLSLAASVAPDPLGVVEATPWSILPHPNAFTASGQSEREVVLAAAREQVKRLRLALVRFDRWVTPPSHEPQEILAFISSDMLPVVPLGRVHQALSWRGLDTKGLNSLGSLDLMGRALVLEQEMLGDDGAAEVRGIEDSIWQHLSEQLMKEASVLEERLLDIWKPLCPELRNSETRERQSRMRQQDDNDTAVMEAVREICLERDAALEDCRAAFGREHSELLLDAMPITARGVRCDRDARRKARGRRWGVGSALRDIAIGDKHLIVSHWTGEVFVSGSGVAGRLGLGPVLSNVAASPQGPMWNARRVVGGDDRSLLTRVEGLLTQRVVQVSAGYGTCAVVTEDGALYVWGKTAFGALGIGEIPTDVEAFAVKPLRVQFGLPNPRDPLAGPAVQVRQVSCGNCHSACTSVDGRLFVWGTSTCGRLGLPPDVLPRGGKPGVSSCVSVPTLVTEFLERKQRVASVSCGSSHTMVATAIEQAFDPNHRGSPQEGGVVFVAGSPLACGASGTGFTRVRGKLQHERVVQIAAGFMHCTALTEHGELYTWGSNEGGALGVPVSQLKALSVRDPVLVECLYRKPFNLCLDRAEGTSQSSVYNRAGASRAVDGDCESNEMHKLSHTQREPNPWWEIDLGRLCSLTRIVVWNRSDMPADPVLPRNKFIERLFPCWLFISDHPFPDGNGFGSLERAISSAKLKRRFPKVTDSITWILNDGTRGRYVRLQMEREEVMNIRQVQIFGWPTRHPKPGKVLHVSAGTKTTVACVGTRASPDVVRSVFSRAVLDDPENALILGHLPLYSELFQEWQRKHWREGSMESVQNRVTKWYLKCLKHLAGDAEQLGADVGAIHRWTLRRVCHELLNQNGANWSSEALDNRGESSDESDESDSGDSEADASTVSDRPAHRVGVFGRLLNSWRSVIAKRG